MRLCEAILHKALATSEQLFCDANHHITMDERACDLVEKHKDKHKKREDAPMAGTLLGQEVLE